jgi:CRISPR/Cas system-associated exonuclease Cas4 (RecB family)
MKTFLEEIAEKLYHENKHHLDATTVVFPNRRATLYFRQHLSAKIDRPVFSPKLVTIEDFIAGYSSLKIPDKLELIHRLHQVYARVAGFEEEKSAQETFDQFYFWGDMLLRDFDEVDKYMVDARYLFKDLSQQKEIDAAFDFLTEEQIEFLKSFWLNFDEKDSANKGKFLRLWKKLPEVYDAFREELMQEGFAYEGMVQRAVAEKFKTGAVKMPASENPMIFFVGFNALTKAEEVIMSTLVADGVATAHWDVDAYYMHNNTQEAGKFFREYKDHPSLGKTFPADIPSNFLKHIKGTSGNAGVINLYGASQTVGQAKIAAQVLEQELLKGIVPEETVFVLPDEKMLMPVLHSISGPVEKLNVTMGFPLSATPLFNLVELLVELQVMKMDGEFNHRAVTSLLGHPYVVAADPAIAKAKTKEILKQSWVSIPVQFLSTDLTLHQLIFKEVKGTHEGNLVRQIIQYLRDIIMELGSIRIADLDKEYCYHFLKLLNRMEDVVGKTPASPVEMTTRLERQGLKSFLRLFRQLIRAEKIPFRGEPLTGLQVMGVLETRNLDFKNVFVLSLNEGAFPAFGSKGSYIPHNIRRAYGLPTADFQDAMYAYLFYRVLQRAENIFLFYTTETDDLGEGEMSRYLQQILYESGVKHKKFILHNPLRPAATEKITVIKDASVFQSLSRFLVGSTATKSLTPTAINDYIECRLRFYFKHVAMIREAKEVEDDLGARVLGTILHDVMEYFYVDLINRKKTSLVEVADLKDYRKEIEVLIDRVFKEAYHLDPEKKVGYEGQRLVVREVVRRFAEEIIKKDKAYAPFEMIGVESAEQTYSIRLDLEGNPEVQLGGYIDRADRKGDLIRVIDYKTGKDTISFKGEVGDLVNRDADRNKAAFQTMVYALLFFKNPKQVGEHVRIVPGLMNRLNLFEQNFTFGLMRDKTYVDDAIPLLPEFEEHLTGLLKEMFDPEVPFDQTEDTDICKWCPYQEICSR